MKRVGFVFVSLFMVILLTGCGTGKEKKLECTISQDNLSQVYSMNFDKKGKFVSAVLKQDMNLSEDMLKQGSLDDYKKTIEASWKKTELGSLNYKVSDNGKDVITLTVDFDDNDIEKLTGGKTSSSDFSYLKKNLEEQKYTCKES